MVNLLQGDALLEIYVDAGLAMNGYTVFSEQARAAILENCKRMTAGSDSSQEPALKTDTGVTPVIHAGMSVGNDWQEKFRIG